MYAPIAPEPPPFEEVCRLHSAAVYRFCLSLVRDPSLAEDIASDVLLNAFRAYEHHGPDPETIRAWLFGIARNTVVDHSRRRKRWERLVQRSILGWDRPVTGVAEKVEIDSELRAALAELKKLPARDQQLIALRVVAELSYRDIGDALGMTEGSAAKATSRAVRRLREAVGWHDE